MRTTRKSLKNFGTMLDQENRYGTLEGWVPDLKLLMRVPLQKILKNM